MDDDRSEGERSNIVPGVDDAAASGGTGATRQ